VPICVSVPPGAPVRAALSAFAIPKSVTTAEPPDSSTLSGLMSRCTMPRSCAYASAFATSRSIADHLGHRQRAVAPSAARAATRRPTNGIV
jgi:hypothetical protein